MFSEASLKTLRDSIATGRPLTGPLDIQLLPTPRCNAACAFCPLVSIPEPLLRQTPRFNTYREDLSGGLLDRLADDLYYLGGLRRVTITGGEPLLYHHLIPAVFQLTRCFPDVEMTVVTNGIRLKKFAGFFADAGLHNLSVSLNAGTAASYLRQNPGAGPDTFAEIVAGLEAVAAARRTHNGRPRLNLSVVLTAASAGDVPAVFELARGVGAQAATFIPLMEILLDGAAVNRGLAVPADDFQRFLAAIEDFGGRARAEGFYLGYAGAASDRGVIDNRGAFAAQPCYAGFTFAAIYPNGDVRPCCHCEPIMGNLKEESFADIWQGSRFNEYRRRMLAIGGAGLPGCFCRECGYLYENREFASRLRAAP